MELKEKSCVLQGPGSSPMHKEEIKKKLPLLSNGWKIVKDKKLRKEFPFVNFNNGMAFVNEIADLAEEQNHHPAVLIEYSKVEVELSTESVGGLTENDFIMAAKIDDL